MSSENIPPESDTTSPVELDESSGNAALDKRLASGVLQGDVGTETAQVWISAFLIAALGFVAYLYAFSIPLHGADLALFGNDSPMGRLVTCLHMLPQLPTGPLSVVGLSLNAVVGGGNIDALHGGSILLHLLCGVLVFLIARRLLPAGTPEAVAMVAGLLFVVHPVASEPVLYLAARPALQSVFFGLSGLALLLRGCAPQCRRVLSISAAVVCFVLAFGSDASAIVYPLIGIVVVYFSCGQGEGTSDFRGVVAAVLLLAVAFMGTAGLAAGLLGETTLREGFLPVVHRLISAAGFGMYYGFVPMNHDLLPVPGATVMGLVGLTLLGLGVAYGCLRNPIPAVVGLWILLTLAGAALYGPQEDVGPTRYLYGPWAALCIVAPWGLQLVSHPKVRMFVGGGMAVLILGLTFLTFQRSSEWTRPVDLWTAEVSKHPDNTYGQQALGRYLMSQLAVLEGNVPGVDKMERQATDVWSELVERLPANGEAHKNLGILASRSKKHDEAREHFLAATARQPEDQDTVLFLAFAAEQQARETGEQRYIIEALRCLERAEKLGPLPLPAEMRLGLLSAQAGDLERGVATLKRAHAKNPDESIEGAIKQFQTLMDQAASLGAQAEEAKRENPQSAATYYYRAQRSFVEGQTLRAFYLLEVALGKEPTNTAIWTLLGIVSAQLNGAENFLAQWGAAQGGNWESWQQLALRCGAAGAWSAAEAYLHYGAGLSDTGNPIPEMVLAETAITLKQPQRAVAYLQAAQKNYPDNPAPWLRLAEIAADAGETAQAKSLLREAVNRNGDPEAVKALTDRLGQDGPAREGITRTVIK